jgi:hypothetical protein
MVFMQRSGWVSRCSSALYVWNEENQWEPLWEDAVRVRSAF